MGKVVLRMAWQNPLETPRPQRSAFDPAKPATAGSPDIRARLQQQGERKSGQFTGGDSLDEAQFGRALHPPPGLPRGARDPQARRAAVLLPPFLIRPSEQ